jgi:hypothetical protein
MHLRESEETQAGGEHLGRKEQQVAQGLGTELCYETVSWRLSNTLSC